MIRSLIETEPGKPGHVFIELPGYDLVMTQEEFGKAYCFIADVQWTSPDTGNHLPYMHGRISDLPS